MLFFCFMQAFIRMTYNDTAFVFLGISIPSGPLAAPLRATFLFDTAKLLKLTKIANADKPIRRPRSSDIKSSTKKFELSPVGLQSRKRKAPGVTL